MKAVRAMVRAAPMGSTMPDRTPLRGFMPADAGRLEGHGDDGPFGQILQSDSQGQGHGSGGTNPRLPGQETGIDDADSHAFGNVVQSHGQDEHRRPLQVAVRSFGFLAVHMQMRHQPVQGQEQENAQPEPGYSRYEGEFP
jgi:hypothetical protein